MSSADLNSGVGDVFGHTVVCVQGVQQKAQYAALSKSFFLTIMVLEKEVAALTEQHGL